MLLEILLNSQENTCARVSFLIKGNSISKHPEKKSKSTPPPSEFLLLWTMVRYTKVRKKSEISGPGKFRNPTFFNCSELDPWTKKWLPWCGNGDYPMLADFNFWEKFLPNNPRNWTWEVLEVEESKYHI